jgi:hypothetical protein
MGWCTANVRFWGGKADIDHIWHLVAAALQKLFCAISDEPMPLEEWALNDVRFGPQRAFSH